MKKRIGRLIVYVTIINFWQFVNNFSELLLCNIYFFDFFNMVKLFRIYVVSLSTEILIVLNFRMGIYT